MTQEALKLALDALETELSIDWTNNDEFNTSAEKMYKAITAIKEAFALWRTPKHSPAEPVGWTDCAETDEGAKALYEAPLQRTEQEPVATVEDNSQQWKGMDGAIAFHLIERHADNWSDARKMMEEWLSANTTPPQRTWLGLEGEEIRNLWEEATKPDRSTMTMVTSFARAIEAKLKQKNGFAEEKNT